MVHLHRRNEAPFSVLSLSTMGAQRTEVGVKVESSQLGGAIVSILPRRPLPSNRWHFTGRQCHRAGFDVGFESSRSSCALASDAFLLGLRCWSASPSRQPLLSHSNGCIRSMYAFRESVQQYRRCDWPVVDSSKTNHFRSILIQCSENLLGF
jgi:hypothetical protein